MRSTETELDLDTVLRIGSLPGVYLEREFAHHRLRSYIGTYIKEEVQEETYLIQDMNRHNDYLERGYRFFYWLDKNGLEVDLVVAR